LGNKICEDFRVFLSHRCNYTLENSVKVGFFRQKQWRIVVDTLLGDKSLIGTNFAHP
jgi:hypothetical protein